MKKMMTAMKEKMRKSFVILGTCLAMVGTLGTTFATATPVAAATSAVSSAATTKTTVKSYTGKKTSHDIVYKVTYNSKTKVVTLKIVNKSNKTISLGWVNDFSVKIKGTKGTKTLTFNTLNCIRQGGLKFNQVAPGKTAVFKSGKISLGTPKSVSIKNVYPLSNDLPTFVFNYSTFSWNTIIYNPSLKMALKK